MVMSYSPLSRTFKLLLNLGDAGIVRVRFPDSASCVEFVGSLLYIKRFSQGIPVSPLHKNQHDLLSLLISVLLSPQLVLQC